MFGRKPIEVFVRHCNFSKISYKKKRIATREECYKNFVSTLDPKLANVTLFLDTFYEMNGEHFLIKEKAPFIEIKEGKETGSFLKLLNHVKNLKLSPDTIVYLLEDDYLHRPGWCGVLKEAFDNLPIQYATLYDHHDKYEPEYSNLRSKIYYTASCHWRTTPSTTNTYAMRFKTLLEDIDIHERFSQTGEVSQDHQKFLALSNEKKREIVSAVPGFSTHTEERYISPVVNWKVFKL